MVKLHSSTRRTIKNILGEKLGTKVCKSVRATRFLVPAAKKVLENPDSRSAARELETAISIAEGN